MTRPGTVDSTSPLKVGSFTSVCRSADPLTSARRRRRALKDPSADWIRYAASSTESAWHTLKSSSVS
jgi:hypothetical protein